jgi:hypothetical protein
VVSINATTNRATELQLELRRGVAVYGRLDDSVPRPIKGGRVIAQVTPSNTELKDDPPGWHVWTETKEDGSFRLDGLPPGLLEIYAMCDGFMSTNVPGQLSMGNVRYPQKHQIGTAEVWIQIGMERTARVEVTVLNDAGKPLPDAKVSAWPMIRYGEWMTAYFGADCYSTAEFLEKGSIEWHRPSDLETHTDSNGMAILANVPATETGFGVEHAEFELPAVDDGGGQKSRAGWMKLTTGQTNRMSIRLERKGTMEIAHYPRK